MVLHPLDFLTWHRRSSFAMPFYVRCAWSGDNSGMKFADSQGKLANELPLVFCIYIYIYMIWYVLICNIYMCNHVCLLSRYLSIDLSIYLSIYICICIYWHTHTHQYADIQHLVNFTGDPSGSQLPCQVEHFPDTFGKCLGARKI